MKNALRALMFVLVACQPTRELPVEPPIPITLGLQLGATQLTAPNTIRIEVSTNSAKPLVTELLENQKVIHRWEIPPYTHNRLLDQAGMYSYVARTEVVGKTILSPSKNLEVLAAPDLEAPRVTLTLDRTNIIAPQDLQIRVEATDNKSVTQVQLLENDTIIQQWSAAPFTLTKRFTNSGSFKYKAIAIDAAGNTTTSPLQTLTVEAAPNPSTAVSFVSSSPVIDANAISSLNLATPVGVQEQDVLIAILCINATASNTVTPPSGWLLEAGYPLVENAAAIKSVWIFSKYVNNNQSNQNQFQLNQASNARAIILAYRGVQRIREAHTIQNAASPVVAPAVDTIKDAMVLRILTLSPVNHLRRVEDTSNLSIRYDSGATTNLTLLLADQIQSNTGSSGTRGFIVKDDFNRVFIESFTAVTLALEP